MKIASRKIRTARFLSNQTRRICSQGIRQLRGVKLHIRFHLIWKCCLPNVSVRGECSSISWKWSPIIAITFVKRSRKCGRYQLFQYPRHDLQLLRIVSFTFLCIADKIHLEHMTFTAVPCRSASLPLSVLYNHSITRVHKLVVSFV